MANKKNKTASNRRVERTRAFQSIYSLFFNPADSVRALARRFCLTIYAPPLPDGYNPVVHSQIERTDEGAAPPPSLAGFPDIEPDEIFIPDSLAPGSEALPQGFAWELLLGAWSKREDLDNLIRRFSQNWRLERMGRVELALLRLAGYELLFRDDVPPRVVINEAIELSRQFGDEASRSFVNGILDAMVKAVESGELSRKSVFWEEK